MLCIEDYACSGALILISLKSQRWCPLDNIFSTNQLRRNWKEKEKRGKGKEGFCGTPSCFCLLSPFCPCLFKRRPPINSFDSNIKKFFLMASLWEQQKTLLDLKFRDFILRIMSLMMPAPFQDRSSWKYSNDSMALRTLISLRMMMQWSGASTLFPRQRFPVPRQLWVLWPFLSCSVLGGRCRWGWCYNAFCLGFLG